MAESVGNGKRTAEFAENECSATTKKRKIEFRFDELNLPSLNAALLRRGRFFDMPPADVPPAKLSNSDAGDLCSDDSPSSRCSSNELSEVVQVESSRFLDLEAFQGKSLETESSTTFIDNKYSSPRACSRDKIPSGGFSRDLDDMDSPAPVSEVKNCRRKSPEMPTQAEIEEFFAVAEEDVHTRFTEKYNYDVVKDVPLEGRYQWVRLMP
uniref:Cyclin-dependent kinase inhibitor n=1 Tax=Rhizophora mucronata TaxID=61149 RepID=A0A2P2MXN7_RHIMU